MEMLVLSSTHLKGEIMVIVTDGIDLATNVFAVHGVDESGKPALVRQEVARAKLLELIAHLQPCLAGMEACSGAHHWAREFAQFGHTVRLMDPKFVAPYRMSGERGKNDAADAAAKNRTDPVSCWANSVQERRGYWKAVVATAAKNARMCWAMLQRGEAFKLPV